MDEPRPYRQDAPGRRRIASVVSLVLLAAAVLAAWYFHFRSQDRDSFAGKIVQISGSIRDVGLVKEYRPGRAIIYYSAASGFQDLVFHRLQDADAIAVIAADAADFRRMKEAERPAGAPPPAGLEAGEDSGGSLPPPMKVVAGDEEAGKSPPQPEGNYPAAAAPAAARGEDPGRERSESLGYEQKREEGLWEYDRAVRELAAKAERIDALWEKHASFCQGTIAVAVGNVYGREWFGVYTSINAADTPECRMMVQEIRDLAAEIDGGMEAAWEKAHRAGVYPGQIRSVQQKYRMELDRWNK